MTNAPAVLIVDDDITTVLLLEAIFQQEGYRTVSADSGPAARALVARCHPDHVPANRPARVIDLEADILGVFEVAVFGQVELAVEPGDRLFLYTDGLIEAATTIAQDEASCVVYGMPKAGVVNHVIPLDAMAAKITALVRSRRP